MTLSVSPAIEDATIRVEERCQVPLSNCAVQMCPTTLRDDVGFVVSRCARLGRPVHQGSPERAPGASVAVSGFLTVEGGSPWNVGDCGAADCAQVMCKCGGCGGGASVRETVSSEEAVRPLAGGVGAVECAGGGAGTSADGIRCTSHFSDAGGLSKNEFSRRHRSHYRCRSGESGGGTCCGCCFHPQKHQQKGGQTQGVHNSPFSSANGAGWPSHRGTASSHYHHNQVHGVPRQFHQRSTGRSRRRNGFGAAAVEAIRNRFHAGYMGFCLAGSTSATKCNKLSKQAVNNGDQEPRIGFQVPLPRSKTAGVPGHPSITSSDVGTAKSVKRDLRIELDNLFSTTEFINDPGNSASRLASIAPLFDRAIQQLILECDRRVASASDGAVVGTQSLCSSFASQKHPSTHFSVNTHSFDAPLTSSVRPPFASLQRGASFATLTVEQVRSQGTQLESPQQPLQAGLAVTRSEDMAKIPLLEPGGEERALGCRGVHFSSISDGLFRRRSEDLIDLGSSTSKLQLLIVSVGLNVAYGDSAPLVLIVTLIYLSRIVMRCDSEYSSVTAANWYRLTTVALLVATKMYVDGSGCWNECFSSVTSIPLKELNKLEVDFLFLLDFDALITEEEVEVRADWMDSVASRHDMLTPLRTFVLGSSCAPSSAATPLSSGDEGFRSLPHVFSTNMPATPLSLTPSNMTPVNCFSTPFTNPKQSRNQCPVFPVSCAESSERLQPPNRPPNLRRLSSSLCPCDRMSPLPLTMQSGSLTERLFSVVHAPAEPDTPPSLRQLARCDGGPLSPLAPPDQEGMSPMFFFCNSASARRYNNKMATTGGVADKGSLMSDGAKRCAYGAAVGGEWSKNEAGEDATPPHPRRCILSPPTQEGPSLPPPPGMTDFHHRFPGR